LGAIFLTHGISQLLTSPLSDNSTKTANIDPISDSLSGRWANVSAEGECVYDAVVIAVAMTKFTLPILQTFNE
jgi:hypothetical protein